VIEVKVDQPLGVMRRALARLVRHQPSKGDAVALEGVIANFPRRGEHIPEMFDMRLVRPVLNLPQHGLQGQVSIGAVCASLQTHSQQERRAATWRSRVGAEIA